MIWRCRSCMLPARWPRPRCDRCEHARILDRAFRPTRLDDAYIDQAEHDRITAVLARRGVAQ